MNHYFCLPHLASFGTKHLFLHHDTVMLGAAQYSKPHKEFFNLYIVGSHLVNRLHGALKFNGGGHLNHSIFWQNLCPGGFKFKHENFLRCNIFSKGLVNQRASLRQQLSGTLEALLPWKRNCPPALLLSRWGSWLKAGEMVKFYILQGSGWGWLGYNKAAGKLQIAACPNQVNFYTVILLEIYISYQPWKSTILQHSGPPGGHHWPCTSVWHWCLGARLLSPGSYHLHILVIGFHTFFVPHECLLFVF